MPKINYRKLFKISKVLVGWNVHDLSSLRCNGANCDCRCAVHVICAWNRKKYCKSKSQSQLGLILTIHFINNIVQDRRYIIIMFIQYLSRQSKY